MNDNLVDPNVTPAVPVTPEIPATPETPPVTPPVTPVTPPVTPPVAPATPPAVDTTEIEKNISEKVSKSVIAKIGEALGLTKKEEEKIPTDPVELAKFVEEKSAKTVKQILDDKDKENEDQRAEQQQQLQEGSQRYTDLWNNQYEQLANAGKVPKIVDINNVEDPGRVVKVRLLIKMKEILDQNERDGVNEVPTIKEIFYEYPEVLTNKVAGATVPVSGGGRSHIPGKVTYDDIHKSSFEEILENG